MRGYQAGGSNGLPPIKLYEIESLDDISNKIKLHGTALFEN
jgi:hypothetical protein